MGGGRAYKKKTKVRTLRDTASKPVAEEYTKEFRNNGYTVVPRNEKKPEKEPEQERTPQWRITANPNKTNRYRPIGFDASTENARIEYAMRVLLDAGYSITYRKRADGKNYSYYDGSKKKQVLLTDDEVLELEREVLSNKKSRS